MKIDRIFKPEVSTSLNLPYFISQVPAGFPSPAEDYRDGKLDLNEHLIQHPSATFFCRVSGDSMTGAGIYDKDLLVVDRAIKPIQGDVVLAVINGGLTCKILDIRNSQLLPANDKYPSIPIHEGFDFEIEGVVINSIRFHRVRSS